jgi:hypothetical protein
LPNRLQRQRLRHVESLNSDRVNAVFHGHAHYGILEGKTSTDIPVYNVSAPTLCKTGKPFRIVEL